MNPELMFKHGDDAGDLVIAGLPATPSATTPPSFETLAFTNAELLAANISPRAIVTSYLYADVATLSAPGGTGKTTQSIYEMVCIALKRPLYGLPIDARGWCLFITAEDRREYLAARLREIMAAMVLTDAERRIVLDRVRIWDVTGEPVKLVANFDGNVGLTTLADNIIEAYRDNPPILITFDPIVSFGASEGMVNDNEQAIITAARRIVRAFDCCVRLIAHTGKANARERTLDQYTSRGGSALSDGSRMVSVLQPWTAESGNGLSPPYGCTEQPGSSITILARPKLSYAKPNLPLIWIRRTGYLFESFTDLQVSKVDKQRAMIDQVERFLIGEEKAGRKHSKTTLESAAHNLSRKEIRIAIDLLTVQGRVHERDLPKEEQRTRRKTYLAVAAGFGGIPDMPQDAAPEILPVNNAAAYREKETASLKRPFFPLGSNDAEMIRQDSAALAGLLWDAPETPAWEGDL